MDSSSGFSSGGYARSSSDVCAAFTILIQPLPLAAQTGLFCQSASYRKHGIIQHGWHWHQGNNVSMTEYVCASCIDEDALKEFIEWNADETYCDFCGESYDKDYSIPIDDLLKHMRECISREYDDAANWLSYESSEGGYQGPTIDAYDLIVELQIDFPKDESGALLQYVLSDFSNQVWCENNPYGMNSLDVAQFSWEQFSRIVKHERRYFFGAIKQENIFSEALTPGELLTRILDYAEHMFLVEDNDAGLIIHRARAWKNGQPWNTPEELGPPPTDKASQPNRMSPAGIPMFYGSESLETAVLETASGPGTFSVGKFETNRPIVLLDISNVPPLPSIFKMIPDSLEVDPRRAIEFLAHISEEISKPITRDGRQHIEYVPTQVVTEFIRAQELLGRTAIDGIKYESARNPGHSSYVLFATQDDVFNENDDRNRNPWLELKSVGYVRAALTHKEIDLPGDFDISDV